MMNRIKQTLNFKLPLNLPRKPDELLSPSEALSSIDDDDEETSSVLTFGSRYGEFFSPFTSSSSLIFRACAGRPTVSPTIHLVKVCVASAVCQLTQKKTAVNTTVSMPESHKPSRSRPFVSAASQI